MYLTYKEYCGLGGVASELDYPLLEALARKKLNYWTNNRILEPDTDIKFCMFLIINYFFESKNSDSNIESISHDGVSIKYSADNTRESKEDELYGKIVEILPYNLVSICVN